MDNQELERVIATANQNIKNGVIEEPRIFFDEIEIQNDQTVTYGTADAFRNGEEYPMQIRSMTAAIRYLDAANQPILDERLIQRVGLRFTFHGQDYMRRDFVFAPAWHSKPTAGGQPVENSTSVFKFSRPFILSARDAMRVKVQLDVAPGASPPATRPFTVSFLGYGLDSRRPYFKSASLNLATDLVTAMDAGLYKNDGDEPIVVTEMSISIGAESLDADPTGDIRIGRVQIAQVGNGTQADWVQGPATDISGINTGPELCPAVLLGPTVGRAVAHCWPPDIEEANGGLYWEPGEGIQLEVKTQQSLTDEVNAVLCVALLGTIIVS